MSKVTFCQFAAEPDMLNYEFVVKVLTGIPEEIAATAIRWGFDGIEFMPNPERIPDPVIFEKALNNAGAVMPVVNSGRISAQGMGLLHEDPAVRRKAIDGFKRILEFAGYFGARVGLGAARGRGIPGIGKRELRKMAEEIFRGLAEHARRAEAVIMLEAAESEFTSLFNTNREAMAIVKRINSPSFSVMLDTHQLWAAEKSLEDGIRITEGRAEHIHLYEPGRWPPGIFPDREVLDWKHVARILREERFHGSASIVIAPEGDSESLARRSLAYLRRLFAGQAPIGLA